MPKTSSAWCCDRAGGKTSRPRLGYSSAASPEAEDDDEEDLVDEVDRMRCIALALELWGPTEYPFGQELEEIPDKVLGPGIILAFE